METFLKNFAKEVHENSCKHGFWDGECNLEEKMALIHAEWSEALEEYRADRPMIWFECEEIKEVLHVCDPKDETDCLLFDTRATCPHRGKKPEGIAVELIDGCLRILDFASKFGTELELEEIEPPQKNLPSLVAHLHYYTATAQSSIGRHGDLIDSDWKEWLGAAVHDVFRYLLQNGINPTMLMRMKHEYNKTRPYKHGKKC